MRRFCLKNKGAISVFLTLILVPTFIFSGVLVDGSRILGAKNLVSGAGDLAMNAALSNYQEELNKTYGLLAMASTAEEVNDIMKDFFEISLNASGISQEDFSKALIYLELMNDDFVASNPAGTQIYETAVIRQEILEYMKYRAPVTLLDRAITDRIGEFENMDKERKAAEGQLKFESELEDVQEIFDEIKKLTDEQEGIYKDIKTEQQFNTMLTQIREKYKKITMLAVAYQRMTTCSDKTKGDVKSLMEQMVDYACDISNIDANIASNIINMIRIKNGMSGKNPNDVLNGLDKDDEEYGKMQKLIEDYDSACENMVEGIKNTEEQLDELVDGVYKEISAQYKLSERGEKNCDKIKEKLEKLREKFEDLKEKYDNWETAVNNLPEGDSKSAYNESLEKVKGFFTDEGIVGRFEEKIDNNKVFYNEVFTKLDAVTFTGQRLAVDITNKNVFMGEADYGLITSAAEITNAGNDFMVRYYDGGSMNLSVGNIDISDDEFVMELKIFYCNKDGSNEARSKEESKKWNNELSDMLDKLEKLMTSDDINDTNINTVGKGDIPSVWLGISMFSGTANSGEIAVEGGLDNKESRKKVSDSGSDNLNKDNASIKDMCELPSRLGNVGNGAGMGVVEPLILTEYVIGMFSHYTSDKNTDGSEISEPLSLSRDKLKDNALYRAEVEYILWGNPRLRDNVGITKAIIFASNLVFNMSFAFTNTHIRGDALTVANFFPVGPLARTAIKCALQAMVGTIETVKNIIDICDGKKVPLIKGNNTWDTWIINHGGTKNENAAGFTYDDYLWILVCVKMFLSPDTLLARTADCIELNMTDSKSNNDNTLRDMYTMVNIEAKVKINTFFLPRLSGSGYSDQEIDDESFKIQYHGMQGY